MKTMTIQKTVATIRGNSPVSDELAATSVCYEAIKKLPPRSQDTVLDWLSLRLKRERSG